WRPRAFQCLAKSLWTFIGFYGLSGLCLAAAGFYLRSQMTSMERHFRVSTGKMGVLMAANDIGSVAAVMFVSHLPFKSVYGAEDPPVTFLGGLCVSAIALVQAVDPQSLPTVGPTGRGSADPFAAILGNPMLLCVARPPFMGMFIGEDGQIDFEKIQKVMRSLPTDGNGLDSIQWGFYYTFVIMVVIGMLGSPRIPLQIFYIESNVKEKTESGVKTGTLNTALMFGGPMALLIGYPIGMLPVDLKDTQLSFLDPRWIGAWWLGFLIFGVAAMLFSLPVFCLPKRIRSTKEEEQSRKESRRSSNSSQVSGPSVTAVSRVQAFKEFLYTTVKVLSRPIIVLVMLNMFCMILGVSGTISFQIKYIENQYDMPAHKISLYLGLGSLGTILVGVFLGGAVTTRLKLGVLGMFRMSLVGNFLALLCAVSFLFLGCDNHQIVGYNQDIGNITDLGCQCVSQALLVVCGEDGRNYLSPCLAGCAQSQGMGFKQCAYVGGQGTAVPGFCQNCDLFPPFMALFILMTMCMLATITPQTLMIARLVPIRDQPNVMALTSVVFTVGMLVGPIIFGQIYDSTCSLWSPFSEMCVIPDKVALREVFIASDIYIRIGGFILLVIANILVHCQKDKLDHGGETFSNDVSGKTSGKRSGVDHTKPSSRTGETGSRTMKKVGKDSNARGVPEIGGRIWRKSLSHMRTDKDTGDGVVGVFYCRRRSTQYPDMRGVTFGYSDDSKPIDSSEDILQNHEGATSNESGALPKLGGFLQGQINPVYQDDEVSVPFYVDNGYDSISSKGDEYRGNGPDNGEVRFHVGDDEDDVESNYRSQNNSFGLDDLDGMFDA
ncbi:hypothetical protein EGW08_015750, partial [Elysia chlorotica]